MRIIKIEKNAFNTSVYHSPGQRGSAEEIQLPFIKAQVDALGEGIDALVAMADLQGYEVLGEKGYGRLAGHFVADELAAASELELLPPLSRCGILLAGDMHSVPGCLKRGGSGDVREVWRSLAAKAAWVAGVPGNHDLFGDSTEDLESFCAEPRMHLLNGEIIELDGLKVAGLGGVIGNPRKPFRWSAEDYSREAKKLLTQQPDVFVIHEPPGLENSPPRGNPVVAEALAAAEKPLIICGHKHWDDPLMTLSGGAQVLNVHERVVVLVRRSAPSRRGEGRG